MSRQIAETLFKIIQENQSIFEIPSEYASPENFPNFISRKLDDYYGLLKNHNIGKIVNTVNWSEGLEKDFQLLNRIRRLKDALNKSIGLYYEGKIAKAYETFNTALDNIVVFRANTVLSKIEPNSIFYRIGNGENRPVVSRSDNFHIRFDFRHYCATQRYSVPGIPSIYLGDSAYICYKELNSIPYKNAYISKFITKESIQIIEIQTLDGFYKQYQEEVAIDYKLTHVLRFLLLYPLYVACTVKVLNDGAFKAEYIIPQFLLQYVADDERIRGVKYPSTKIYANNKFRNWTSHNYVFPVVGSRESGFCPTLSSMFDLTIPLSFENLTAKQNYTGKLKDYNTSDFFKIEQLLAKEKTDNVLK